MIEATCTRLAESPARAEDCGYIVPDYRRRRVGSHVMYLRPTDYGFAIIRILHHRMDTARHL